MPCRDRWGHSILNLPFGNRMQALITGHAASERAQPPHEIESGHYLRSLPAAVGLAQPISTRHSGVFEQSAVPRQQDPLLFGGDLYQFRIRGAISVFGVESQHA